jgi:anti-anti-sigma factor
MRSDPTPPAGEPSPTPTVEVLVQPDSGPGFVAIVKLRGEHDLASRTVLENALAPLKGDILVDLSECDYIDSSVIAVVVQTHANLTREGYRVEMLIPPTKRHIARTVEVSGISKIVPVRTTLDADPRK